MGLGSRIRDPEKTSSGSRIQSQKGTGSPIHDTWEKIYGSVVVGPMRPNFIGFGFEEGRNKPK
jgi:hypothetical protein